MPENYLRLQQHGSFEGEFTVTTGDRTFSIGDYIEVFLSGPPYPVEVVKTPDGKERHVIAFPLTVTECCHIDEIEVILKVSEGTLSFQHWSDCLSVGILSVVTPIKYKYKNFIWYMPKIDGWIRGMFGKVKAGSI